MVYPPIQRMLPVWDEVFLRCKKFWVRLYNQAYLAPDFHIKRALFIANAVQARLKHHRTDVILSTLTPYSTAFLETKIPLVHWIDNVYATLANFYPRYRWFDVDSHWDGHIIENANLHNAKCLIFSSEWAARAAKEFYGISAHKIHVVPFGANIDVSHTILEMKEIIKRRSRKCIKLLFVGKEWYQKGGDIVLEVAKELHYQGWPVEVTLVGEIDKGILPLPSYVKYEGMLSKKEPQQAERLEQLYRESHFLFVPSRAEAFGIVFCEANAFAVPCITTYVGGITEIVKDGVNGMTFSLDATVKDYCDYIVNLFTNEVDYEALALSAFNEYETRLNWNTTILKVKALMHEVI